MGHAMSGNLGVIVLAAGMGTRMKSRLHKVLHPVCGVPMGIHVIDAARELEPAHDRGRRGPPGRCRPRRLRRARMSRSSNRLS